MNLFFTDIAMQFMMGFQILFWVFLLVALVYFIFKRVEDKRNEDFEDRSN